MYNPFSLQNKVVLITGASSGIGRQTAIECSKLGARVIVTARNEEKLKETLGLLDGEGHEMMMADVTDYNQIETLVNNLPPIDGFSCNAGIADTSLVSFYKEKEIEDVFRTNTFSMMMFMKFLVKKKKLNKGASIVFTSSAGNVFCAAIGNGIYGASKCAIDGFMRTASLELAPKGIRCNSVCPSVVESASNGFSSVLSAEQYEAEKKRYPLGRFCTQTEVALSIAFLLSDASSFITGTAIKIDGGSTLL